MGGFKCNRPIIQYVDKQFHFFSALLSCCFLSHFIIILYKHFFNFFFPLIMSIPFVSLLFERLKQRFILHQSLIVTFQSGWFQVLIPYTLVRDHLSLFFSVVIYSFLVIINSNIIFFPIFFFVFYNFLLFLWSFCCLND